MLLLALAIAPSLAICVYVFYRDVHNREPAINLILSFVWGMVAIVPAVFVEMAVYERLDKSLFSILVGSYLGIALVEEGSKFAVLRYYCFTRKSFDEPLDGIVYSVLVSMGFATVESIFYAYEFGPSTAFMRMITSVPAHATFAIIMGYYVGKARFDWPYRGKLFAKGLLAAVAVHGTYDAFLFLSQNDWLKQYVSELLLFTGAIFSLFIAVRLSRKMIRLHRLTSQQLFKTVPVLTIRNAWVNDIALIRDLSLQVWPQTYAGILSPPQIQYMLDLMYSEKALREQMENHHQFIILYNAGVPIGFASYSETEPTVYKLHKIYVLPLHQGRGTGRFIIQQIINDILPKGATVLVLNVNRFNKAKTFYEKLGFKVIREEDIDIGRGYFMNDYVMEKKLTESGVAVQSLDQNI